jgi:hypothetical protein
MHGHWWVVVVAIIQEKDLLERVPLEDPRPDIGIGPGLSALLTTSRNEKFDPPRAFENARKQLAKAQRKMTRQFEARKTLHQRLVDDAIAWGMEILRLKDIPLSTRLKNQIRGVKLHTKVFNIGDYHHKKTASIFENCYRRVAVEEHGL